MAQADVPSRYLNFDPKGGRTTIEDNASERPKLPMPILDPKLTLNKSALQSHFRLCRSAVKRPEGVRDVHRNVLKAAISTTEASPEPNEQETPAENASLQSKFYVSPKHVVNQVLGYENQQARSEIYLTKIDHRQKESNRDFHKI